MKKKLFLISILSFLTPLFFFSHSSYAVDDFTLTWNSEGRPQFQYLCGGTSNRSCSDYKYLIIDQQFPENFLNIYSNAYLSFVFDSLNVTVPVGNLNDLTFFSLNSSITSIQYNAQYQLPDYLAQSVIIIATLTDTSPFSIPSGSINITENGEYDVSSYAQAIVDVPVEVIQGDYHDDLIAIKVGIYTCAAVLLVLYFFYCIYRVIIKSTGGK